MVGLEFLYPLLSQSTLGAAGSWRSSRADARARACASTHSSAAARNSRTIFDSIAYGGFSTGPKPSNFCKIPVGQGAETRPFFDAPPVCGTVRLTYCSLECKVDVDFGPGAKHTIRESPLGSGTRHTEELPPPPASGATPAKRRAAPDAVHGPSAASSGRSTPLASADGGSGAPSTGRRRKPHRPARQPPRLRRRRWRRRRRHVRPLSLSIPTSAIAL
jgi:hypothetical protein